MIAAAEASAGRAFALLVVTAVADAGFTILSPLSELPDLAAPAAQTDGCCVAAAADRPFVPGVGCGAAYCTAADTGVFRAADAEVTQRSGDTVLASGLVGAVLTASGARSDELTVTPVAEAADRPLFVGAGDDVPVLPAAGTPSQLVPVDAPVAGTALRSEAGDLSAGAAADRAAELRDDIAVTGSLQQLQQPGKRDGAVRGRGGQRVRSLGQVSVQLACPHGAPRHGRR